MTRPLRLLALSAASLAFAPPALAQDAQPQPQAQIPAQASPDQEERDRQAQEAVDDSSIVVTGSLRVRQGGAQDITHFRSIAADVGMPRPESLTIEGLMGEHDLTLPAAEGSCRQLF